MSSGTTVHVPFVDLHALHAPLEEEFHEALALVLSRNEFGNGPLVASFEEAFGSFCGGADCVGVSNGIDAVRLLLVAAGLEPGYRVLEIGRAHV